MTGRRGFALTELLIALVIAGIIGVALTRLVVNQSRFIALQDGLMRARGGARAALNVLAEELRGVTTGGLLAATADSVTFRMPYLFGVACGQQSGTTVMSVLPADGARYGSATAAGYAWRDSLGLWQFVEPATIGALSTALAATCGSGMGGGPPVQVLGATGWAATGLAVAPNVLATTAGSPMYLYQEVTYRFGPSSELPGRRALWRRVTGSSAEELVAPFDTAAQFRYLYGKALTPVAVPAILDSVAAVRAALAAASEVAPSGRTAPVLMNLTADLYFRSRDP